jgi:hypothetical protein
MIESFNASLPLRANVILEIVDVAVVVSVMMAMVVVVVVNVCVVVLVVKNRTKKACKLVRSAQTLPSHLEQLWEVGGLSVILRGVHHDVYCLCTMIRLRIHRGPTKLLLTNALYRSV